jgi:predicted RNase H-like nuclease (RuvC/YqgF family)
MDIAESLEKATQRIIALEQELGEWQKTALDKVPPSQLSDRITKQQIETLTFHILKARQQIDDLNKQNFRKKREIESALEEIRKLHLELDIKAKIVDKLKTLCELKKQQDEVEAQKAREDKAQVNAARQASDSASKNQIPRRNPIGEILPKGHKSKNTLKDLVELMSRIDHMKLLDASILLDVPPETIDIWSHKLAKKGLLVVEGKSIDKKQIFATDKIRAIR